MLLKNNQKVLIFRTDDKLIEKIDFDHIFSKKVKVDHTIFQELFPLMCAFTYNKRMQEFLGEDIQCVIFEGDSNLLMKQMKDRQEPFLIKDHLPAFLS
jgi:predicted Holliday junction resolvase-like endonuclease